jgi:hypothetical protein
MAEWLKAAVLKTVELARAPGVRIPLSPPDIGLSAIFCNIKQANGVPFD